MPAASSFTTQAFRLRPRRFPADIAIVRIRQAGHDVAAVRSLLHGITVFIRGSTQAFLPDQGARRVQFHDPGVIEFPVDAGDVTVNRTRSTGHDIAAIRSLLHSLAPNFEAGSTQASLPFDSWSGRTLNGGGDRDDRTEQSCRKNEYRKPVLSHTDTTSI